MSYADPEKRRETQRRWRERNRAKLREYYRTKYGAEYKRKWREMTPGQREAERKARKTYYERNKEEERRKSREYMRTYYLRHKDTAEYRTTYKKKYAQQKAWFKGFVATLSCIRCGENDPECLDFHHPVPKGKSNGRRIEPPISRLVTRKKEFIIQEAKKCLVLCANCHRKEHARLRRLQEK
jgi:hypothetical protein